MKLSIILPVYNEEGCITKTITEIAEELEKEKINYEIVMVDNGTDNSSKTANALTKKYPLNILGKSTPPTFAGAIKKGIENSKGDAVTIVMADASDDPKDIVQYYKKLQEGYDCVFGSRFIKGSKIDNYPKAKMLANRLTNTLIRTLFLIKHNDITNAFKAYKKTTLQHIAPIHARDFNISVEFALKAITYGHTYATVPISWRGRESGVPKMNVKKMTKKYLYTILTVWLEKMLLKDELTR